MYEVSNKIIRKETNIEPLDGDFLEVNCVGPLSCNQIHKFLNSLL